MKASASWTWSKAVDIETIAVFTFKYRNRGKPLLCERLQHLRHLVHGDDGPSNPCFPLYCITDLHPDSFLDDLPKLGIIDRTITPPERIDAATLDLHKAQDVVRKLQVKTSSHP